MAGVNKYILIYGAPCEEFYLKNKKGHILLCEMRPSLYGPKVLLEKLKKKKIRSTLICDNGLGHMFFTNKIKKAYIFSCKDNTFPAGSNLVKILADRHKIPVEIQIGANPEYIANADTDASTFLGEKIAANDTKAIAAKNEIII